MRKKKLLSLLLAMALVLTTVIVPSGSVFAAESKTAFEVPATAGLSKNTYDFSASADGFYRFVVPAAEDGNDLRCSVYLNGASKAEYSVWQKDKFDCTLQLKAGDKVTVEIGSKVKRQLTIEKVEKTISGSEGKIKWSLNLETGALKVTGTGTLAGTEWDGNAKWIKSVVISKGVTKVGKYAFANSAFGLNAELQSVSLPSTVTTIAYGAFDHCGSLTKINLPSGLKTIETGAFIFCRKLKTVQVSGGKTNTKLKSIGYAAFAGCDSLKKLTIPWGVTTIGDYAYGYTDSKSAENSEWDMMTKMTMKETVSKVSGATIVGITQSQAQSYAKANGVKFTGTKKGSTLKTPTITLSNNNLKISISKVTGATGYEVYAKSPYSSTWTKYATVKASSRVYKIQNSFVGTQYKVRAYRKSSTGGYQYSSFSKVKTLK